VTQNGRMLQHVPLDLRSRVAEQVHPRLKRLLTIRAAIAEVWAVFGVSMREFRKRLYTVVKSPAFSAWYFHPTNVGGKRAKRDLRVSAGLQRSDPARRGQCKAKPWFRPLAAARHSARLLKRTDLDAWRQQRQQEHHRELQQLRMQAVAAADATKSR